MESKPVLWMVGSEIVPEREQEFNEWYDRVHVPMVLECPGVMRASRYQIVEPVPGLTKYLAIYELANEATIRAVNESPQLLAAREDRIKRFGETDLSIKWRVYYKQITP
ncbi:MAG TPA: hypothetical protein G4O03_00860 [Dehalococcoidia bacterium]|nr:hypothetical protein [Dehalococcoidia bacterium]